MSLTGSLSDLQISIPFFVPSVEERGAPAGRGSRVRTGVRRVPGRGGSSSASRRGWGCSGSPGTRGDNVQSPAPHVPKTGAESRLVRGQRFNPSSPACFCADSSPLNRNLERKS